MVGKRILAATCAAGLLACCISIADAAGQSLRKVGLIWNSIPQAELDRGVTTHGGLQAIEASLRDRGWIQGKNLHLISRSAESRYERMPELAAQLARLGVEVLVVFGPEAADAAQRHAPGTPVVWAGSYTLRADARPSPMVTGYTLAVGPLPAKRLEMLKAIAPRASRVAIFAQAPPDRGAPTLGPRLRESARALSLDIFPAFFSHPDELPGAFARAVAEGANAAYMSIFPELTWNTAIQRRVVELSRRYGLATIYELPAITRAGGLIAYGLDDLHAQRRATYFIDRILRGAKPGDLPIEQVSKFDLSVNRRTARELGLEVPPSLAVLADSIHD